MPKKRSKSPKRTKPKKKTSPSPKTSKTGKRTKSKERKQSPSREKESPLVQKKRLSIKATQVSEGSLEDILHQLGGNSRVSLTIQTKESRGRSLARADRTDQNEPNYRYGMEMPLRRNSASDLKQMANTEILRAQTTRKNATASDLKQMANTEILRTQTTRRNSYRLDDIDPRTDYREKQIASERAFTPRELYMGRDSEEFQEQNVRTIQYEIVPPAKGFQQQISPERPRDPRYAKETKDTKDPKVMYKNEKDFYQPMKQRSRNDSPDTLEGLLVRPTSRLSFGEQNQKAYKDTSSVRQDYQTRQNTNDNESHSSHEVHKILPPFKYPTNQHVEEPKNMLTPKDTPSRSDRIPMQKDTPPKSDQALRRLSDQAQQKNIPSSQETMPRFEQAQRRQPDRVQQRNIPSSQETMTRSDQVSRRQSDQAQQKSIPSSQDTMLRSDQAPRRAPDRAQQKNIPPSQETIPRPDQAPRRQSDQVQQKSIPSSQDTIPRSDQAQRRASDRAQQNYIPPSQETIPRSDQTPRRAPQQNNIRLSQEIMPRYDQVPRRQSDQVQQKSIPSSQDTMSRPDQVPRRAPDRAQQRNIPPSQETIPRSDQAPRRQSDQVQQKSIPSLQDTIPRSGQVPRRAPDRAQQKNIPPSQETIPRSDQAPRRQSGQAQQKDFVSSQEKVPKPNNQLRNQLEQEIPIAVAKRQAIPPENVSKQSDVIQETLKANDLYKGPSTHLVLYYDIMSPQSRSCLMLICLLKLDVDLKYTDISKGDQLTEEYLKLNPVHTVPTLLTDDMIFTDSHTILMYLCDNSSNPLAQQLYPQNYMVRLRIMNCLFFEAQVLYRRHSNFMTDIVRKEFANIDYAFHEKKILEAYETLNSFLKNSSYLVGDAMTIADISIVATISALDLMFPIDQYQNLWPELSNWFRSMRSIPMYRLNFAGVMKQGDTVEKYGKFEISNRNRESR